MFFRPDLANSPSLQKKVVKNTSGSVLQIGPHVLQPDETIDLDLQDVAKYLKPSDFTNGRVQYIGESKMNVYSNVKPYKVLSGTVTTAGTPVAVKHELDTTPELAFVAVGKAFIVNKDATNIYVDAVANNTNFTVVVFY